VVHRPERQHINADSLSRIPYRCDEDGCRTVVESSQHVESGVHSRLSLDEQASENHAFDLNYLPDVGKDEAQEVSMEPPRL